MHKLLERQVKRLLGSDPSPLPEGFLGAVDQAYRQADEDRVLLERSMELTSQELLERYEELRREVAERSRLEEQVLQSQKMEAVGQLAGGIAHDFNNLLTVIKASCKLCQTRVASSGDPAGEALAEDLGQIADAAHSAADLTGQLLAYSRQQVLDPQVLDLNRALERLEEMLGRLIGEHRLTLELVAEPATVLADQSRIQQAVMNLVLNARDAMPEGGEITLRTENLEIGDPADLPFELEDPPPERLVLLSVRDTGPGIDPAVRRRIFEPFFTTKERGAGTGLGLATVYGIVKQSGGHIWVDSEPGRGAEFKIALPETEPRRLPAAEEEDEAAPVAPADLLVVEDNPVVRLVLRKVLAPEHRVSTAATPEEALELVDGGLAVDVLVTDISMPGMTGFELAERLCTSLPHLEVLYVSAYDPEAYKARGLLRPGINFVAKPFDPDQLLQTLRRVVARSG